jgi:hypothetical protein
MAECAALFHPTLRCCRAKNRLEVIGARGTLVLFLFWFEKPCPSRRFQLRYRLLPMKQKASHGSSAIIFLQYFSTIYKPLPVPYMKIDR